MLGQLIRYGRIAHHGAFYNAQTGKMNALAIDAESYPSLDLLVAGIIAGTAKQLKTGVERAGEQIRKFFSRYALKLTSA